MKTIAVGTGTPFQKQKVSANNANTSQTQYKHKPVHHIRPQLTRLCPNSSWNPTSQIADGAPPYQGFQRYEYIL